MKMTDEFVIEESQGSKDCILNFRLNSGEKILIHLDRIYRYFPTAIGSLEKWREQMLITIPNYVKSKGGWIEYHIYVDSEFQGTGFWKSPGESGL